MAEPRQPGRRREPAPADRRPTDRSQPEPRSPGAVKGTLVGGVLGLVALVGLLAMAFVALLILSLCTGGLRIGDESKPSCVPVRVQIEPGLLAGRAGEPRARVEGADGRPVRTFVKFVVVDAQGRSTSLGLFATGFDDVTRVPDFFLGEELLTTDLRDLRVESQAKVSRGELPAYCSGVGSVVL